MTMQLFKIDHHNENGEDLGLYVTAASPLDAASLWFPWYLHMNAIDDLDAGTPTDRAGRGERRHAGAAALLGDDHRATRQVEAGGAVMATNSWGYRRHEPIGENKTWRLMNGQEVEAGPVTASDLDEAMTALNTWDTRRIQVIENGSWVWAV